MSLRTLTFTQITVYYVSANYTLASAVWSSGENWTSLDSGQYLGDYSTAVGTRSISVTLIPGGMSLWLSANETNLNVNFALLYYENPNGNVSILLNCANHNRKGPDLSFWLDVTSQLETGLQQSLPNRWATSLTPSMPFTGGIYNTDPSQPSISLLFCSDREGSFIRQNFNVSTTSNGNFAAGMYYISSNFALLLAS